MSVTPPNPQAANPGRSPHVADVKIEEVRINDFQVIRRGFVLKIDPDARSIRIGGKNRNGKSTLLDSAVMAMLGPTKFKVAEPVRHGETEASISLVTSASLPMIDPEAYQPGREC